MPASRAEPGPRARILLLAALAGAAPGLFSGLQLNPGAWSGALLNPDSYMRLVRIEDMLAAGRPLHAVMRDGSGHGTVLHWSHLLDVLLLVLAAPFATFLGWHRALEMAGLLSGPLSLAALGAATAWAAAPAARPGWLWLGAFAAGAAPLLRSYGLLGVVHHHVLLAVCVAMAAGWAWRLLCGQADAWRAGMALGAWTAFGVWFSPETLPYTLMALGALWVAWLHAPSDRLGTGLRAHGAAFLLVTAVALVLDPPAAGLWGAEPDRLSLPYLAVAAGALLTATTARLTLRWLPILAGLVCAAAWLAAFPQVLHGTQGLMPADQASAFFANITEMAPLAGPAQAADLLTGGVLAAATLCTYAWRGRRSAGVWPIVYAAACVLACIAVAIRHVRFAAYPELAGAIALPVLLSAITAADWTPARQSAARLALIIGLVGGPALRTTLTQASGQTAAGFRACNARDAVPLLAAYPGRIVLSAPDDTPELLFLTRVDTVGSLFHRNVAGFLRLRAAWREVPGEAAGPAFLATGATLVLGCPGQPRSVLVADLPPTTLLDRLDAGRPPAWLRVLGSAGGNVLYTSQPGP